MTQAQLADLTTLLLPIALMVIPAAITGLLAWVATNVVAHIKDERVRRVVLDAALYAEQKIPDKSERYQTVAAVAAARCPYASAQQIDLLIEASVQRIKRGLGGIVTAAGGSPVQAVAAVRAPEPAAPGPAAPGTAPAQSTTATDPRETAVPAPLAVETTPPPPAAGPVPEGYQVVEPGSQQVVGLITPAQEQPGPAA